MMARKESWFGNDGGSHDDGEYTTVHIYYITKRSPVIRRR